MALLDRLAATLLQKHGSVLNNFEKRADGWWVDLKDKTKRDPLPEYKRVTVAFGKNQQARLSCAVADNEELQVIGLQKHAGLSDDEGMIFPYPEPRRVAFHMGEVQFPIDIMFVGSDGRITKKIENIEPGTRGNWGMPNTAAVIEAAGGWCRKNDIQVGCEVYELIEHTAQAHKFIPAFINTVTGKIVPSPGFHNIEVLTLDERLQLDHENNPWDTGFVDEQGKFYTRQEALNAGHYVGTLKEAQHARILEIAYDSKYTGEIVYLKEQAGMFWCETPLASTPMHQDADGAKIDIALLMEQQYSLNDLPQLQWQPYQQRLAARIESWDEISNQWEVVDVPVARGAPAEQIIDALDAALQLDPPTRQSPDFQVVSDSMEADGKRVIHFYWGQGHKGTVKVAQATYPCSMCNRPLTNRDAIHTTDKNGDMKAFCERCYEQFEATFYQAPQQQQPNMKPALAFKRAQTVNNGQDQYHVQEDMMEVSRGNLQGVPFVVMHSPSTLQYWVENELYGTLLAGPAPSIEDLNRQMGTRVAQETFPTHPRKDINPKMMPSVNPTPDRFRDRDLVDNQVQNQPMSPHRQEQQGYDVVTLHDRDDVAPVRSS